MLARPELDKDHEACLKAAEYIEAYGWWNGEGCMPHGHGRPACLIIAINRTALNRGYADKIQTLVRNYIQSDDPNMGLVKWNDSHTKDEVINLLREVAYSCPE